MTTFQKVFNGVIAGIVVILLFLVIHIANRPTVVGNGVINTSQDSFVDGAQLGDNAQKWVTKTMSSGSNSVLIYTNNTGRDVYGDYGAAAIATGETASSTFKVSVFASTTSSINVSNDFATLAEGNRTLLNAVPIATSTTATTTSSVYASQLGKGSGSILIPNGSSVWGYLQANQAAVTGCKGATGLCEQATSSSRGFNPVFDLRIYKRDMQGF